MPEWEFIEVAELARMLQLNPQTIRNWTTAGKLEYVKIGRGRYVPRRAAVKLAGGTGWAMPELFTVAQVAETLQVNQQTVRNWLDAGTLPSIYLGQRRVRVKREDLDRFMSVRESTLRPVGMRASGEEFWSGVSSPNRRLPAVMTIAQVAELLRVNQLTIRNWIDAGTLPAIRVGARRLRIRRDDFDEYITAHTILATVPTSTVGPSHTAPG